MKTETTTRELYQYDELSEEAKQKAVEEHQQSNVDFEWWDFVYDNAATAGDLLGIDIRNRHWKSMNGEQHYDGIDINFSGFSSQGDGARFQGQYRYAKQAPKKILEEFPTDKELLRIATALQSIQAKNFYKLSANCKHGSGHYEHSGCMSVTVYRDGEEIGGDAEEEVTQLMRDFADWIYSQLEESYDYLTSNEAIVETIKANEYDFLEDGTRA